MPERFLTGEQDTGSTGPAPVHRRSAVRRLDPGKALMNKWTRLLTAVTAAATVVTLGLSTASAGSNSPTSPSWQPAGSSTAPAAGGQRTPAVVLSPAVSQTLFVPVTPCRIADTRRAVGPLTNLAVRTFGVQGTSGFAPQGGKSGGCGVPADASGVATNVTVTGAAGAGYLSGYPAGSAEPLSNFVTYSKGVTATVNPTFALATSTARSLSFKAHGGTVQVIIDVTGYYVPQIQAVVAPNGSLYAGTKAIVSSLRTGPGSYSIVTTADVTNCAVIVTIRGGAFYGDGFGSGNTIVVTTWALSSTASAVPTDLYFSFAATC